MRDPLPGERAFNEMEESARFFNAMIGGVVPFVVLGALCLVCIGIPWSNHVTAQHAKRDRIACEHAIPPRDCSSLPKH